MNRQFFPSMIVCALVLAIAIPACFTPDLKGFPCVTDSDCPGLTCQSGVCGGVAGREAIAEVTAEVGQEVPRETPKEVVSDSGIDAPVDEKPSDNASQEVPVDAGPADAKQPDRGTQDQTPQDTPTMDTAPKDEGTKDQPAKDDSPKDAGPKDTGTVDAGPKDTGPPEMRPEPPPTTCQNDGERRRCLPSRGCTQDAMGRVTCTGTCLAGFETCKSGKWGPCVGAVGPQAKETCNRKDDDCDGKTDEFVICADPAHVCINGVCKKDPAGNGGNYAGCFDDNSCQAGKICFDVGGNRSPYKVCLPKCNSSGKGCPQSFACTGERGAKYDPAKPHACNTICQFQSHCAQGTSQWRDYKCGGVRHKPPGVNVSVNVCVRK